MKKKTKVAALLSTFCVFMAAGGPEQNPNEPVVEKYAKAIAGVIPVDWTVRIGDHTITIERKAPADFRSTLPSQPPDPPIFHRGPALVISVGGPVSAAELASREKANRDRTKALEMLASQMTDLGRTKPSGDNNGFGAKNAEQQQRLDAYIAVRRAMPEQTIPDLYSADASFKWVDLWLMPVDAQVTTEMEQVHAKITSVFSNKPLR